MQFIKWTAISILGIALVYGTGLLISQGIDRAERVECKTWQEQSQMMNWYATDWQEAQCDRHDISL